MIRVVVENLLLLLLPTIVYVIYVLLTRKEDEQGKGVLDEAPFFWLMAAGVSLAILVVIVFGSADGGKPGQHYTPPSVGADGKIDPGGIK